MKVTLKKLQVFVFASKNNSLTEAAEGCHISHSAASQALAELEVVFGPLFDRVGKRLRLNNNGRLFYAKAKAILDRANELEMIPRDKSAYLAGKLSIGASTTIGNYWLPKYFAQFKQQYPGIEIELTMGNTQSILQGSSQLIFDFALIEDFYTERDLSIEPWVKDKLVIISNNAHALAKQRIVTRDDLQNQQWVIREPGSGTRNIMLTAFEKYFTPQIEITLPTAESIKNYVVNSPCLALLSAYSVETEVKQKIFKIINIESLVVERYFYFVRHVDKYQSIIAQRLESFLKA